MQTIVKFIVGRKFYPVQNRLKLFKVLNRDGKELNIEMFGTSGDSEYFTINTSLAADKEGAYEYFLYDGMRVTSRNILPLPKVLTPEEEKIVTEVIKRDIEYRKAKKLDRANVHTEQKIYPDGRVVYSHCVSAILTDCGKI